MNRQLIFLIMAVAMIAIAAGATEDPQSTSNWQRPADDILEVVHAPQLPWVWTSPTGKTLLLADPILYPHLSELAGPMHKLAGVRVNPKLNAVHGRHGGLSPRLMSVEDGTTTPLALPVGSELMEVDWTVDGTHFALTVAHSDHLGLWVGSIDGEVHKIEGVAINGLLGTGVVWAPDQKRLLVRRIPERGATPKPPEIPAGPEILTADGASSRSTYEARNLLETAHDDALFTFFMNSELVIVDPENGTTDVIGEARPYSMASFSPDGAYLLVQYLVAPWSHEVAWWRFASEVEVWDVDGKKVATVASLPLADEVPAQGVAEGPRQLEWRSTVPHTIYFSEALDGGNPMAEVDYRDRLMKLEAPFDGEPQEVFRAEHRIVGNGWGAQDGTLMLAQFERMRRWLYVWLLDVDDGSSSLWYDRDVSDRYGDPGFPIFRPLPNGKMVMHQEGGDVYFKGSGATEEGDRPFLDRRNLSTGETDRIFRCPTDRYETFIDFAGDDGRFIIRSESAAEVPNYYLARLSERADAPEGEADWSHTREPITRFSDPTPQLREIEKRIVQYEREDGVTLSFHLHLPPGYVEGEPLPTVVYAYPMEYSGASTAGQISGSTERFSRFWGASHMYFLLRGYAVLHNTAMPMIGDPETVYDTFVEQLVADAEAAVAKAVDMGIADPERIGVIGHSHGGLMVANLLAHTDLFAAGIARSGSYNKTNQPFGYQSERRSLFEARDAYIQVSPTFFADTVNEPCLIIHGNDDSNPGTLTFQSEVFFEAVRGSGGTARLVLLPFEDHGYRAIESIEHVLWEQLRWFDRYVKNKKTPEGS